MAWCCRECGSSDIRRIKDVMETREHKIKILKNGKVIESEKYMVETELETDMEYYRCAECNNQSTRGYHGEIEDIAEWKPKRRTK